MTKKKKKIVYAICIITLILITIFAISTTTYAADWDLQIGEEDGTNVADGLAGILTYGAKAIVLVILIVIKFLLSGIVSSGGGAGFTVDLTPADIIFNKLPITTINFFNENTSGLGFISSLQSSVSLWYVTIRNIAVIILLGILLYVGIRMAISTVAAEEAKYKKMFKDWAVSLVLVYVLQYIMIIVIDINNVLVNILKSAFAVDSGNEALANVMTYLYSEAWSVSFTQGVGCTILYGILIMITFLFLIMYLKRVIITAFLIIISPLITITYSIDKMGDGKSQALNNWLKEFCYNILIQPFHCIIYGALVLTSVTAMATDKSVATLIMSIVAMLFMFKAEDLVKKIFGVQPSSLGNVLAGGAFALTAMNMLKKKNSDPKKTQGKMTNDKAPNLAGKDYSSAAAGAGAAAGSNGGGLNGGAGGSNGGNNGGGPNGGGAGGSEEPAPIPPTPTKGQKAGRIIGNLGKAYVKGSAKVGAAAAGAILGAGTGDAKGVMAGAALGGTAARGVQNAHNNHQYKRDTKENEQVLASEYLAWSQEQGIDNEEGLLSRTEEIMNADLEKGNLNAGDLKYRQYLDSMAEQYKGAGDDDSVAKQHVLNTIKETQMGWINPKGHESTGGYERPTRQQELEREVSRYNTSEAEATEQRAREVREAANRNRTQTNQNGNGGNSPTMDSIDPPNVN